MTIEIINELLLLATAGVGAGIAIVGTLMGGFIKAKFPTKAAMLMGIYATALSLGSTVSAGATGSIANRFSSGWRIASGVWAVLGIIAIVAWLVVSIRERNRVPKVSTFKMRLPLRNRTAWLIALFFACDNLLFYALLSWTSPMYREHGLSTTVAGLVLASFTEAFMLANPVFGWLSKSHDRRGWLTASAVLTVIGLVPIAIWPSFAPFVFIPISAFGLGGGFTLGMTLPLDNTKTVEESNVWNAFVMMIGYLIAATGPLIVGVLRDVSGSFHSSVWLLVGVACVMLAFTPFLRPANR